jgi:hypothetical protein
MLDVRLVTPKSRLKIRIIMSQTTVFQAVWQVPTEGGRVIYFSDRSSGRDSINLLPNPYRAGTWFCALRLDGNMQKIVIVC